MTDITKSLGCMEDMSLGIDSENQVRNGVSYTVRKLPIPYPAANETEITALDVSTYILARLFTGDTAKDYIYKEFDTSGIPSTGAGTWIPLLSDGVGDLAITVGATYVSTSSFTILGDYTLQLPDGTYPTLTTDVGGIAKSTVLSSSFDGAETLVTLTEEVVAPNLAYVTLSNYAEVLAAAISAFESSGASSIANIEANGASSIANIEANGASSIANIEANGTTAIAAVTQGGNQAISEFNQSSGESVTNAIESVLQSIDGVVEEGINQDFGFITQPVTQIIDYGSLS